MVSAKRTRRRPPPRSVSSTAAVLERAVRPPSTSRVIEKTALRSGIVQHGKARRASVASNWVVAITRDVPSSSNVLR